MVGLNCAVRPWVARIERLDVAAPLTAVLVRDVAIAVRFKAPATAKLTAPVVMATDCEAPGRE